MASEDLLSCQCVLVGDISVTPALGLPDEGGQAMKMNSLLILNPNSMYSLNSKSTSFFL